MCQLWGGSKTKHERVFRPFCEDTRTTQGEARVFGSRALGNYKNGSDIDLAILGKRVHETTARRIPLLLNQELFIPYRVDVVCYELCENESLRSHIAAYGRKFEP